MKRFSFSILLFLFAAAPAFADSGFFIRPDCAAIAAPDAFSTYCLQTTTASGRVAGSPYVWNGSAWVGAGPAGPPGPTGPAGGVTTLKDEGSSLTQRDTLNFIGAGVTCVDNAGQTRTDCTIGGGATDVQIFTTTGANTWTKPANAKHVFVYLVGGGGGGEGGKRGATLSIRGGGSGAGGGALTKGAFPASILGATETVNVGAGGSGGAGATVDNTQGGTGTDGGATSFGAWLKAGGGKKGQTRSPGTGELDGGDGGGGADPETNSAFPGIQAKGAGGGGGGGGIDSGNGVNDGAAAGGASSLLRNTAVSGGAAGTSGATCTAGGNATNVTTNEATGGAGGGGGGARVSGGPGCNGGNGGLYGGGGGGGGASLNGQTSGAGGAGGNGIAIVVTVF